MYIYTYTHTHTHKIDTLLAELTKKEVRGRRTKLLKTRTEMGDVKMSNKEIKRSISYYCTQLCAKKLENLEELNILQDTYNLPEQRQEDGENIITLIPKMKMIESPTNFSSRVMDSQMFINDYTL